MLQLVICAVTFAGKKIVSSYLRPFLPQAVCQEFLMFMTFVFSGIVIS
jgi:hypothetical protein